VTVLEVIAFTMVGIGATCVVLTDDPLRQALVLGVYGVLLTSLFFVLQAPDVALSMLVVSAVLLPTLVLLALSRLRDVDEQRLGEEDGEDQGAGG
jgi:uncharacterized MnhB-related membrane protein